jgi:hypothetical protein
MNKIVYSVLCVMPFILYSMDNTTKGKDSKIILTLSKKTLSTHGAYSSTKRIPIGDSVEINANKRTSPDFKRVQNNQRFTEQFKAEENIK